MVSFHKITHILYSNVLSILMHDVITLPEVGYHQILYFGLWW